MKNITKLIDNDRFYNWYLGYTQIKLPFGSGTNYYHVNTYSTSGTISTQYFGEKFNAEKFENNFFFHQININAYENIYTNTTLHFEVENLSMKGFEFSLDGTVVDKRFLGNAKTSI